MAVERFPIRVGPRSASILRLVYGIRPGGAWIELGDAPDGELLVTFGRTTFRTPLANLASWRLEGPWTWIKAIGIRMSFRAHDVSFDGSAHGGIRIDFRQPVKWSYFHVRAIYASADDEAAVGAALAARGVPGQDARTPGS